MDVLVSTEQHGAEPRMVLCRRADGPTTGVPCWEDDGLGGRWGMWSPLVVTQCGSR